MATFTETPIGIFQVSKQGKNLLVFIPKDCHNKVKHKDKVLLIKITTVKK